MWSTLVVGLALVAASNVALSQHSNPNHVRWVLRAGNRPFVQGGYGLDRLEHRQFSGSFADLGRVQLTLGYSELRPYRDLLLALDERSAYGSYAGTETSWRTADSSSVQGSSWQIGVAFKGGYGYPVGANLAIVPAFGSSFDVTRLSTTRPSSLQAADSSILDRYEGAFRFGHTAEAELRFELSRSFSLSGSYQLSVIYPRVVFWQWVASYGIAAVSMGVVSQFSVEIIRSSPALGPIISWLLKGALAYGIYALWRDDMHWPFKSEAPMTHQSGLLSVSIVF
jgi:hypothetical protein